MDLDRDGVIGQHEGVEPQGVNISGPPPKAIVKVSDMDSPQEVKLTVSTEAEAPKPREPLMKEEQKQSFQPTKPRAIAYADLFTPQMREYVPETTASKEQAKESKQSKKSGVGMGEVEKTLEKPTEETKRDI